MDVAHPYRAVVPTLDGDVLVALARSSAPMTGREVARLVPDASHVGVKRVLDRLVDQGLVLRDQAGSAHLHTLNRRHVAAPAVETLASLRSETISRLRRELEGWEPQPIHASMFGSAARATGDAGSDIDLFVVAADEAADDPRWEAQLDALAEEVEAWTGNRAQLLVVSERDLRDLRDQDDGLLERVRTDAIDLAGARARVIL